MTGSAKHSLRRAVLSAAIVCTAGAALSLAAHQSQNQSAPSAAAPAPKPAANTAGKVPATVPAPDPTTNTTGKDPANVPVADPATTERLTQLRVEVERLKVELDLRQRLQNPWVQAAPWIALGVVGVVVAVGWLIFISKERERVWKKHPDPTTLNTLTKSINELRGEVEAARADVEGLTENVQALWKTLAGIATGSGTPRATRPVRPLPKTSPPVTSPPSTSAPATPPITSPAAPATPLDTAPPDTTAPATPPVTSPPDAPAKDEDPK